MKTDRRARLLETARDAMLALSMDDLMREEGEYWQGENERLLDDPQAALPEALDQRTERTIRRIISGKERRRVGAAVRRATARVSVVFLAVFILFSFTFATVSAVRRPVLDLFIRNFGEGAFISAEPVEVDDSPGFGPRWLPPGNWTTDIYVDDMLIIYNYDDGRSIHYSELPVGETAIIDTEDVDFSERIINDRVYLFAEKNGSIAVYWKSEREDGDVMCDLFVNGFDEDDVMKILQHCR